jgi:nucleoside-diphosphate-sugar epimerase
MLDIKYNNPSPPSPQGIAKAVGKALGKEPKVLLYDPEALGLGGKGKAEGFPFRTIHFFASSEKAKRELGWTPKHTFLDDVKDLVEDYKRLGRESKEIDFTIDDKIIASV